MSASSSLDQPRIGRLRGGLGRVHDSTCWLLQDPPHPPLEDHITILQTALSTYELTISLSPHPALQSTCGHTILHRPPEGRPTLLISDGSSPPVILGWLAGELW